MHMGVLVARVPVHHVCAGEGQKRVPDSLGLELQTIVSAGNKTQVLCKSSRCL